MQCVQLCTWLYNVSVLIMSVFVGNMDVEQIVVIFVYQNYQLKLVCQTIIEFKRRILCQHVYIPAHL